MISLKEIPKMAINYNKLKKGVGKWTSFYRENPHRLVIDYLGMKWLKPFQQALILMCFKYTYVWPLIL